MSHTALFFPPLCFQPKLQQTAQGGSSLHGSQLTWNVLWRLLLAGSQGRVHVHHLQAGPQGGQDLGGYVGRAWGPQLAISHGDWGPPGGSPHASLRQEGLLARHATPRLWALAT